MTSICMRKLTTIFPRTIHFRNVSSTQVLYFSVISNGHHFISQSCVHLLQKHEKIHSLDNAKSVHALSITVGTLPSQEPVFICNCILSMYLSMGNIRLAHMLFCRMPEKNVVSYNTMIGSFSRNGYFQEAWELFREMRLCDMKPTQFTFGGLLSCCLIGTLQGMQLQALIEKVGLLFAESFSGTALLGMYARNGCLNDAISVFDCMPRKNTVTWNSMIAVFGEKGLVEYVMYLLSEMMRCGMDLSSSTFVSVLSCFNEVNVVLGEHIHGLVVKYGFDSVVSISNCLINMYAKLAGADLAEKMFKKTSVKDVVTWNTLIGALENCDRSSKALDVFLEMCSTGLSPNEASIVNVLNSCSRLQASSFGEFIHTKMVKRGLENGEYSSSALIDFYAKCSKMEDALLCFDGIKEKNLVAWNSLMLGYSNTGSSASVRLLREMISSGYSPNEYSFSIVSRSSSQIELLQLHSLMLKMGYHKYDFVLSSLICSYARNGLVSEALIFVHPGDTTLPVVSSNVIAWIYNQDGQYEKTQELYATVKDPDTVSWNILIAACSRNGDAKEAFELFHQMRISHILPDNYTYVSLISLCTQVCNIALGSSLHSVLVKTDFQLCDTFICNTMIYMYGKCGSLESAIKIFNEMVEKNVISWTALVSVLGLHGHAQEALEKFAQMEQNGFKPDKVAFLAVLSACRHVGLVQQGLSLFKEMKLKYYVEPEMDHYLMMVDLLAKYGHLREAEKLILGMPIPPNALIWRSFLLGCKKQANI